MIQARGIRREGFEARRRILGPEHPETLDVLNNLGTAIRAGGRYSEAEHVFREVEEIRTRVLGPDHPATLASLHGLAWAYQYQGRFAEAEPIWARLLDMRRRVMSARHPDTLTGWMMLALVRLQQKRFADAESTSRELLTAYQESAPDNWRRIYTQAILGASLARERKYEEAEPILTSAYDSLVEKRDSMLAEFRPSIADWGERIVAMYQSWGRAEKAAEWREKAGNSDTPLYSPHEPHSVADVTCPLESATPENEALHCHLLLLVASKGQEKATSNPPLSRDHKFLALSVDPVMGHYAARVARSIWMPASRTSRNQQSD